MTCFNSIHVPWLSLVKVLLESSNAGPPIGQLRIMAPGLWTFPIMIEAEVKSIQIWSCLLKPTPNEYQYAIVQDFTSLVALPPNHIFARCLSLAVPHTLFTVY